jgi:hypothetical protein
MDNAEGGWDDQRVPGRHGERRGGTVMMEPSRGAVVELGASAERGEVGAA